jgi:hypothetical protein
MKSAYLLIAIVSFAYGCNKAQAFDLSELKVSYTEGTSWSKRPENNIWWQAGMPYKYQLAGDSRNFAVSDWLDKTFFNDLLQFKVEANYMEFGKISGNLTFVSDENYSWNANDPCRHPCEAARSAVWTGESKGLGVSIMPTYRYKKNEIGVRIGLMRHITETNVVAQNFHDNMIKDPNPSIGYYNMSDRGFSLYYGYQMKIADNAGGELNIVYIHAPNVSATSYGWQRDVKYLSVFWIKKI